MRLILLSLFLAGCGTVPGTVKVYSVQQDKGGLVRAQDKEVKPFTQARGYLCESPEDFRDTVTCSGGGVKVWYLEPSKGLVRKQQNQVKSFSAAKGYLCVSNQDLKSILENCSKGSG